MLHKDIRAALPPSAKANLYYKDLPGEIRDELWDDYSEPELADIAAKVARLALQAASTHVVFNNNMQDQGQRNAALLMHLLHR